MGIETFFQYIIAGITYGTIYAIVAIGFNIIYNATGIINFAQGEFVMLGGMTAVTLNTYMPLPAAIVCAVIITMAVGAIIEILFIRWLKNPAVLRLTIITIGLSILIREIALHIWGTDVKSLPYFTGTAVTTISFGGVLVSPQILWVIGISGIMVIILSFFFNYTLAGRQMRACASNSDAARLCGINAKNMVSLSFILSAGLGALAGCVVCPITYVQYDSGTSLAIKGFTVAILGGLGNSTAAIAAGMILGILESFSIWIMPTAYKDVIAITILLLILFLRPSGLFGNAEASRLKEF
jgi:branched-chain amino acid transport system permease protein